MARAAAIRSLPFRPAAKPELGFEMFRLSDLYARAQQRRLDHALEAPQRPDFHTVYVGIRGRGRILVDFTPVPLGANTVTFVARGRVQSFDARSGADAWMLLFAPEFLASGPTSADPLAASSVLAAMWTSPSIAVPPALHQELLRVVELLAAEDARPLDEMQPWVLSALLRTLLLQTARLAGRIAPRHASLGKFFTILERDHARTRSVAHYARAAGLSPRRLAELLVAETGKSTKQIVDDRVVLEHKRLLAGTRLSVKEIAARTGFDEPTNLVKFFRHHTGMTPLEFRRNLPSGRLS